MVKQEVRRYRFKRLTSEEYRDLLIRIERDLRLVRLKMNSSYWKYTSNYELRYVFVGKDLLFKGQERDFALPTKIRIIRHLLKYYVKDHRSLMKDKTIRGNGLLHLIKEPLEEVKKKEDYDEIETTYKRLQKKELLRKKNYYWYLTGRYFMLHRAGKSWIPLVERIVNYTDLGIYDIMVYVKQIVETQKEDNWLW